jgi:hypothetical protein
VRLGPADEKVIMPNGDRNFECGAVYRRTESLASAREIDSFECTVCGVTMESWNTTWVPAYRLVIGPIRKPD